MNKKFYRSLISIMSLLAFLNVITIILPIFSYAKVGLTTVTTTHIFGYQLIGKLLTSQIKDTAMIVFVVSYIVLILVSLNMITKALTVLAKGEYDRKSLTISSVIVFIVSLVVNVFVFVLIKQPNLPELLNESSEIAYKAGIGSYISLLTSLISMIIAVNIRKIAKNNNNK